MAKILGDGRHQRTRVFTDLQSHYLFDDRFGSPGNGDEKGRAEGLVSCAQHNILMPIPSFESFRVSNACLGRMDARLRGHTDSIGQRMERNLEALLSLSPESCDASDKQVGRVSYPPPLPLGWLWRFSC